MSPNKGKSRFFNAFVFGVMALASVSCSASGDRNKPQGPPPEAIDACADLSEGDKCSFTGRRDEEINGSCIVLPRDDEGLACAPEGRPPVRQGGPNSSGQ